MVRHRHPLRPLWLSRPRGGGFLFGLAYGWWWVPFIPRNAKPSISNYEELEFDKVNEILFRLGIIYKQQSKYEDSLTCFDRILRNPPSPLAHADIWFQIGHVYEQQKDVSDHTCIILTHLTFGSQHERAKDAYERVVADNPSHAKVLQQLGWLYHQDGSSFQNQDLAIQYLTKSLEADSQDAQSWYLLGRAYMAGQKYNKAYEAYQQAVYRDGRNPTFWCSIGVLYFQINQFRDALDAYSRAIRINPYISEVWFDLGSLYESCNNQISDAIDAYARASELDPNNPVISQRLQLLKTAQATGGQLPAAPGPQDVHPTAYASAVVPPPGLSGAPMLLAGGAAGRPMFSPDSRGPPGDTLPGHHNLPSGRNSPGPFRGGPPPPVILDETRHVPSQTPLAPMMSDDRGDRYPPPGPIRGHQSLLLHQPLPNQHPDGPPPTHHHPEYMTRPLRVPSTSPPPPRTRSPYQRYPQPVGPAQSSAVPSPRAYSHDAPHRPLDSEGGWDRRSNDHHWDRRRDYPGGPPPHASYPPSRASPPSHGYSPGPSPHNSHPPRQHWDNKPPSGASNYHNTPPHHDQPPRRYDPLGRDDRGYAPVEGTSAGIPPPPRHPHRSESPRPTPGPESKRRRVPKDKEVDGPPPPATAPGPEPKKERKKRTTTKKAKDDQPPMPTPVPLKGKGTPEPLSSNSSVPSTRPSPPGSTLRPPSRVVDEDYDEPGVADALMGLAGYRAPEPPNGAPVQSPTGRGRPPSAEHRDSVSSSASRSRHSPASRSDSLKRPLSPAAEDASENKRLRMDNVRRPSPGSGGRDTPVPSLRQSPVPFRIQPASRSPEVRQSINEPAPYSQSPPLPAKLPPHPKPIGAGHSNGNIHQLPPIATLASPTSTTPSHPSPAAASAPDDRMQVDSGPRSASPLSRPKPADALPPIRASHSRSNSGGTHPTRGTASPTSSRHSQEKMEV